MVGQTGESLNLLFQTLADWDQHLQSHNIQFEEPSP
jgi:hypothetical protein